MARKDPAKAGNAARPTHAGGRPPKYSPEVHRLIVASVKRGRPDWACAEAAGVAADTLSDWKSQGRQGVEPYAALLADMKAAERTRTESRLKKIDEAEDWRATAWLLERQRPAEFGRSRLDKVTLPEGATTADLFDAIAKRALEIGDVDAAMQAAKEAAHLRAEYPADRGALSKSGLDDETAGMIRDRGAFIVALVDALRTKGGPESVVDAADGRNLG